MTNRPIKYEHGRTAFLASFSWRDKAVLFGWLTETQFKNVNRYILIVIRWGLPCVAACKAYVDEGSYTDED